MIRKHRDGKSRLLEIDNVHFEDCGEPPTLDAADYLGYFENSHGEQWVFVGDRKSKTAVLLGGDAEWARRFEMTAEQLMPDVTPSEDERWWLVTCWSALLCDRPHIVAKRWDEQAKKCAEKLAAKIEKERRQ